MKHGKQHEKDSYVNKEWKEIEEEYKVTDTELRKEGDTPTEEVKKWREQRKERVMIMKLIADGTKAKG